MRRRQGSSKFWSKIERAETCWIWKASVNGKGYGQLYVDGSNHMAHRYSYSLHKGPIPKGLFILHKCDNRRCVNPDHLFIGSHDDNMRDMVQKKRQAVGSDVAGSKLTPEQVKRIRELRDMKVTYKDIAAMFNISAYHVRDICTGKYWKCAV